jgi:hypothetical protein
MTVYRDGSALLLDADQVARGIAEGAVANTVRLLGRLLDDLGAADLQPLEGAVEVLHGGQAWCGSVTRASRFLTGLVTCFATHDGIPAVARAAWRR